jgi:hypothetical protein
MHNRIGRRAAIAGVDRMAVEAVMGSILQPPPNEGAFVPRDWIAPAAMQRAINGLCHLRSMGKTPDRALCMDVAITRAGITAAFGQGAGLSSMLGQIVRSRI